MSEIEKIYAQSNQTEMDSKSHYANAKTVYEEFGRIFDEPDGFENVHAILGTEDALGSLESMERVFAEREDYERCAKVVKWRESMLNLPALRGIVTGEEVGILAR